MVYSTTLYGIRRRPTLPGRVQPSTIGAEGLNFCVRYGNRWNPFAIATGNCCIFLGAEVGALSLIILAQGIVLSSGSLPLPRSFRSCFPGCSPFQLAPVGTIKSNACCAFTLRYSRPLSHLDNCTVKKNLFYLVGPFRLRL